MLREISDVILCNETCENDKGLLRSAKEAMINYLNITDSTAEIMANLKDEIDSDIFFSQM